MDAAATLKIVDEEWEAALPSLQEFVRIPNTSVAYDPEWASNGLLSKVANHAADWVKAANIPGCTVEVLEDDGFSPLVFIEIPGTEGSTKATETFLMYGHLDKQPHGPGWKEDIDPTGGLIRDGYVYGRGSGDDGYAVYSSIIAVKALQRQGVAHPRMAIILETSEESGSPHLGHYVEKLAPRIGQPLAVYCLDSIIIDYDTLWVTTSLRGVVVGTLEVGILKDGLHSGLGGGVVPDAFRVARRLLARVEDPDTGDILLPELKTKIPVERQEQTKALASTVGRPGTEFPWRPGAHPEGEQDAFRMHLANAWEPCMTVTGFDGLPKPERAGNVLNASVKLSLSFRLPPLVDHEKAAKAIKAAFETDPPCGATVTAAFGGGHAAKGWNAPELPENLLKAVSEACRACFGGKDVGYLGIGGTIPLMGMLEQMFPDAAMLVTGVLGPGCNMHGPNECLPIAYTKKFTAAVALVMGTIELAADSQPSDVPLAAHPRPRRRTSTGSSKARFCFTQPEVPVGQCLCCL